MRGLGKNMRVNLATCRWTIGKFHPGSRCGRLVSVCDTALPWRRKIRCALLLGMCVNVSGEPFWSVNCPDDSVNWVNRGSMLHGGTLVSFKLTQKQVHTCTMRAQLMLCVAWNPGSPECTRHHRPGSPRGRNLAVNDANGRINKTRKRHTQI